MNAIVVLLYAVCKQQAVIVFPYDLQLEEPISFHDDIKAVVSSKNVKSSVQPIQDCNGAAIKTKASSVSQVTTYYSYVYTLDVALCK
jgi:hypothetical protein